MRRKYKLIVLDIDGTLLSSEGVLRPRVREALARAALSGVKVTLATGRRLRSALPVAEQLGLTCPLILSNGALIVEPRSMKTLYHRPLFKATADLVVGVVRRRGMTAILYKHELQGKDVFYERVPSFHQARLFLETNRAYAQRVDDLIRLCEFDPLKVAVYDEEPRIRLLARDFLSCSLPPHKLLVAAAHPGWLLEAFHRSCSKANALRILVRRLGLSLKDVIAIGDNTNDIEMVASAGLGVAMGNAVRELKASAGLVTSSNDEDGVAEVVEKYVL